MKSDRKYWLDDPCNINKIVYGLAAVCALLLAVNLLTQWLGNMNEHFRFESWFGFFGVFGFFSFIGIVVVAKVMRKLLKREEDYYDR